MDDGKIVLSDDGNTLNYLELVGVSFKSSTGRKDILECIKLNYGVAVSRDFEISKTIDNAVFVQAKHDMLRAMLEISDFAVERTRSY